MVNFTRNTEFMRKRFNYSFIIIFFIFFQYSYSQKLYETEGFASYYAEDFHGKLTASGEIYDMHKFTCAHPYLPFNTWLKVTNVTNNKSVIVRVNDRGPFLRNRIIDLSFAAARALGVIGPGSIYVKLEIVNPTLTSQDSPQKSNEITIPQLNEEDISIRFKTKTLESKDTRSIDSYGLYNNEYKKVNISKGYLIQIASFSTLKNAQTFIHSIEEIPQSDLYIYFAPPGLYRIVIGIFNSLNEAEIQKQKYRDIFPDCLIISYK